MFSAIDGCFQFAINGLFTMDLSWLFMFGSAITTNMVILATKCAKKIKRQRAEKKKPK